MQFVKIPIPQSAFIIDPKTGRPTREWYAFLEALSGIAGGLSSLPQARIWIGDSSGNPIAHAVSGDLTLSDVGVALLQNTANVQSIINADIIFTSTNNILANQVFGA